MHYEVFHMEHQNMIMRTLSVQILCSDTHVCHGLEFANVLYLRLVLTMHI